MATKQVPPQLPQRFEFNYAHGQAGDDGQMAMNRHSRGKYVEYDDVKHLIEGVWYVCVGCSKPIKAIEPKPDQFVKCDCGEECVLLEIVCQHYAAKKSVVSFPMLPLDEGE